MRVADPKPRRAKSPKNCAGRLSRRSTANIQDMANLLYKIPKIIEKASDRIVMHIMDVSGGDFDRQIDLILQEAEILKDAERSCDQAGDAQLVAFANQLKELELKGRYRQQASSRCSRATAMCARSSCAATFMICWKRWLTGSAMSPVIVLQIVLKHS